VTGRSFKVRIIYVVMVGVVGVGVLVDVHVVHLMAGVRP